jgi:hypothetical protein
MSTTQRNTRRRPAQVSVDEKPTTQLSMLTVVNRSECHNHDADLGEACYFVEGLTEEHPIVGICNARAMRAGMDGEINPNSLTRRPFDRPTSNTER